LGFRLYFQLRDIDEVHRVAFVPPGAHRIGSATPPVPWVTVPHRDEKGLLIELIGVLPCLFEEFQVAIGIGLRFLFKGRELIRKLEHLYFRILQDPVKAPVPPVPD
jgi:hypothetical protein